MWSYFHEHSMSLDFYGPTSVETSSSSFAWLNLCETDRACTFEIVFGANKKDPTWVAIVTSSVQKYYWLILLTASSLKAFMLSVSSPLRQRTGKAYTFNININCSTIYDEKYFQITYNGDSTHKLQCLKRDRFVTQLCLLSWLGGMPVLSAYP
jgi:hypothetical protein